MKSARRLLLYGASVAASVGVFLLIRNAGRGLVAGGAEAVVGGQRAAANAGAAASSSSAGSVIHVLLALAVIVVTAHLVGAVFRRLGQPQVMGEVVAGILLGPSFLGWLAPQTASRLIAADVVPYLGVISQIGVVLYMFLVGVELDTGLLRQRTRASIAISHTSIVAPFLLGSALALWIYPNYASRGVAFTPFALFLGVAMSITAFPVLARILTDRGMQKSPTGVLALACAAAGDVTAWCLLAFVVAVTRAEPGKTIYVLVLTAAYILFVLFVARPGVLWLIRRQEREGRTTRGMFAAICSALLVAAFATEWIGIHALFGAFLLGAVLPHDSGLARDLRAKCEDLVLVLLLPVFFAFTGLDADRINWRRAGMVGVRGDYCGGVGGKVWREFCCGAFVGSGVARGGVAGCADEHAGIDGVDRAECRAGFGGVVAAAVCDVCGDGAGDDVSYGADIGGASAKAMRGVAGAKSRPPDGEMLVSAETVKL
jgi:Kef-type K+ transport system membrane component KefB